VPAETVNDVLAAALEAERQQEQPAAKVA